MRETADRPGLPLLDRLWFKSAALFCAVFFLTFFGGWLYDGLASLGTNLAAEDGKSVQTPTPLDTNVEKDLANVVSYDLTPDRTDIRDPFTDRSNLSEPSVAAASASSNSNVSQPNVSPAAKVSGGGQPVPQTAPATSEQPVPVDPASAEATIARIRARDENILAGRDGGPESSVFAVADLQPVGVVSGGNGEQEVLFYTKALGRVLSFPVGAKFYDGWLIGLRPEGVEFGAYGANTVRFKSWSSGN